MPTLSILAPVAPLRTEQLLPYAALVQWTGAHRLWQGQTLAVDPQQSFAAVASAGFRVPSATGVTLMPLRHPVEAALQARTLAAITGHPYVAGFGPGARSFQAAMLGRPYASPLTATREYVRAVRAALRSTPEDGDRTYFPASTVLAPLPTPPVEIGLGVLRTGMARVAGEVADVAITWLTPAAHLRDTLIPALQDGAAQAGRPAPRVVAMVPMALRRPDRDMVGTVLASNAGHLALPHYRAMLAAAGVVIDPADRDGSVRNLVQGGAFLFDDEDGLAKQIREYFDSGVDEVVINVGGVCQTEGAGVALRELETLVQVGAA
ncbi:LLM class flavin-dependent oxidoreductase [Nakamurella flavida]|uniref:LLM class flavin-dependent oxidoreductase n=1 Tax=Nakamurella flavida TaxID=363630 RepID=A0A938YFJ4_9ACTN|nr:LLM class flavin-dependent oxidoreductase [Nakamurella flavida]MBM9476750.1 LLM class flavin-dependent oxidoreductase [Nakamurella flavida]MDP9778812.1 alkanesulfonate monooxygenase SsuD/methylene tetrahydromethanopterin reductase-like flavin-dependent oxidoreductase (luciferase family) [Nakamurella flavida]